MKQNIEELNRLLHFCSNDLHQSCRRNEIGWGWGRGGYNTFQETKCFKNNLASTSALWEWERFKHLYHEAQYLTTKSKDMCHIPLKKSKNNTY